MQENMALPTILEEVRILREKVAAASLPEDLVQKVIGMLDRLERLVAFGGYSAEYEVVARYVSWVIALPWQIETEDNLDLKHAKEVLEKNHYGMQKIKDRILEYLAVLSLTHERPASMHMTVLCLVGLPGVGKTSVASSIAAALNRPFIRIPMGGLGSAAQLRGLAKSAVNAEPGEVIKGLKRAQSRNPVILFDEIDRVSEGVRGDVMGVLLELLDPEQNMAYTDYYVDYPFDLSRALFLCSGNNTGGIANAVLDRLEVIEMPSYSDEEKLAIAHSYLFPRALTASGLMPEQLQIEDAVWTSIVRPLGYDAGIRTLERTILGICRKVARALVEGTVTQVRVTPDNVKQYLPEW